MTAAPEARRVAYTYRPAQSALRDIDEVAAILRRAGRRLATRADAIRFAVQLALSPATQQPVAAADPAAPAVEPAAGALKSIAIPLHGRRARGRCMVLDADVWEAGQAAGWPAKFTVAYQPHGDVEYVVSHGPPLGLPHKKVPLARVIVGARPGQVVTFIDGQTFNLQRSNLHCGTRAESNGLIDARRAAAASRSGAQKAAKTPAASAGPAVPTGLDRPLQPALCGPTAVVPAIVPLSPYQHAPEVTLDDLLGKPRAD